MFVRLFVGPRTQKSRPHSEAAPQRELDLYKS
jgi:hypothetical protein